MLSALIQFSLDDVLPCLCLQQLSVHLLCNAFLLSRPAQLAKQLAQVPGHPSLVTQLRFI